MLARLEDIGRPAVREFEARRKRIAYSIVGVIAVGATAYFFGDLWIGRSSTLVSQTTYYATQTLLFVCANTLSNTLVRPTSFRAELIYGFIIGSLFLVGINKVSGLTAEFSSGYRQRNMGSYSLGYDIFHYYMPKAFYNSVLMLAAVGLSSIINTAKNLFVGFRQPAPTPSGEDRQNPRVGAAPMALGPVAAAAEVELNADEVDDEPNHEYAVKVRNRMSIEKIAEEPAPSARVGSYAGRLRARVAQVPEQPVYQFNLPIGTVVLCYKTVSMVGPRGRLVRGPSEFQEAANRYGAEVEQANIPRNPAERRKGDVAPEDGAGGGRRVKARVGNGRG